MAHHGWGSDLDQHERRAACKPSPLPKSKPSPTRPRLAEIVTGQVRIGLQSPASIAANVHRVTSVASTIRPPLRSADAARPARYQGVVNAGVRGGAGMPVQETALLKSGG